LKLNLWEKVDFRAQDNSTETDTTNCFLGSPDSQDSNQTLMFGDSFQDIKISFEKRIGVSHFLELPTTSSMFAEDNHLVSFNKTQSTTTSGAYPMVNKSGPASPSTPLENFDIFELLSEYTTTNRNQESDNTTYTDDELVWEHLPLDIPVQVEAPQFDTKCSHIPKIQKKD